MSLSIPDHPDPQDVGVTMPGAYGWIPELRIVYSDNRASLTFWVHRSANAAATWPGGTRVEPAVRLNISCGSPVPGHPDAVFPHLDELMARAIAEAADRMAASGLALTPEQSAALADIATGGAIRQSIYGTINDLIYPDATEVD
jgi:hypothetical protein